MASYVIVFLAVGTKKTSAFFSTEKLDERWTDIYVNGFTRLPSKAVRWSLRASTLAKRRSWLLTNMKLLVDYDICLIDTITLQLWLKRRWTRIGATNCIAGCFKCVSFGDRQKPLHAGSVRGPMKHIALQGHSVSAWWHITSQIRYIEIWLWAVDAYGEDYRIENRSIPQICARQTDAVVRLVGNKGKKTSNRCPSDAVTITYICICCCLLSDFRVRGILQSRIKYGEIIFIKFLRYSY